ncbi:hypothetical protein HY546_00870, partial [archaeon]|nr:hypothetical protein [archaeon]
MSPWYFLLSLLFPSPLPQEEIEREYRLPLTHEGYIQLKPYFQQSAISRSDIYLHCNNCPAEQKLRLSEKNHKDLCVQTVRKLDETALQCKEFPLTVTYHQQKKQCFSRKHRQLNEAIILSHSLLSQLQRQESTLSQETWKSLSDLIDKDLAFIHTFANNIPQSPLYPSHRNTKLRWYLSESDDALARSLKVFLGITFYLDENGREQTRYELE